MIFLYSIIIRLVNSHEARDYKIEVEAMATKGPKTRKNYVCFSDGQGATTIILLPIAFEGVLSRVWIFRVFELSILKHPNDSNMLL